MPTADQITTSEVMEILGLTDRSSVIHMIRHGRLTPSRKLPGATGAYLFLRSDVLTLVDERAAELRAELARLESAAS